MVIPGEMFPSTRLQEDNVEGTAMEGVEHIGQYVFEMTQAKLKAMGAEDFAVAAEFPDNKDIEELDEDENMAAVGDADEDLTVQEHV